MNAEDILWNFRFSSQKGVRRCASTVSCTEPALGNKRPLHRADVNINEPAGSELGLDGRIHTAHVDEPIWRDFLREEQQKCRAYGQTQGYDLNRLDQGMIPVVLEQHGRTAPRAQVIFQRLLNHRTQLLVRQGLAAYSTAKRQASSELWAKPTGDSPLSESSSTPGKATTWRAVFLGVRALG